MIPHEPGWYKGEAEGRWYPIYYEVSEEGHVRSCRGTIWLPRAAILQSKEIKWSRVENEELLKWLNMDEKPTRVLESRTLDAYKPIK